MPTNPDPDLMRIFDFTAADLEANRTGKMSDRQIKFLREESDADHIAIGCAVRVGLLITGLIAFYYLLQPQQIALSMEAFPQIVIMTVVLAWIYWRYRSNQRANQVDLERCHAGNVEGVATWHRRLRSKRYIYQLTVDGKVFSIQKQAYDAFETFMHLKNKYMVFRIYFAPETVRILSLEIVAL